MRYIDLTMPLSPETPVYPGDPKVEVKPTANLEKDGYVDHTVTLGTHNGTHIDAPAHMIAGGKSLSDFPVDTLIGSAVVVDVVDGYDRADLDKVSAGDVVLFMTGKSANYQASDYYTDYPAVPVELAQRLVDKQVKMVGVDTGSVDHDVFAAHKLLLGNDILIIENLISLDQIAGKSCTIFALPLNLEVEGSPARVVAELSD